MFRSIAAKLSLIVALMLLATCLIVTLINHRISINTLMDQLVNIQLPALSDNIIGTVNTSLLSPGAGLAVASGDPFLKRWIVGGEAQPEQETVYRMLEEVVKLYNLKGCQYGSWSTRDYLSFSDGKRGMKKLTNEDSWFPEFKDSGKAMNINVYVEDKLYGSTAFINRRIEADGAFLGILSIAIDLKDFIKNIADMKLGQKGETFMVNRKGVVVLHQDKGLINKADIAEARGYGPHAARLLASPRSQFEYVNRQGETKYVIARFIPELELYLVTEADQAELFAGLNSALASTALATGLILLAGIGVGVFFVRNLTVPLGRAVAYAEAVQQGDFSVRLEVRGTDEVGRLAEAMRQMVASLKEKIGLFEGVLRGMTVPYLLVDTRERTLFTNDECLRMVEAEGRPEDHLGRTLAEIFYNDPSRQTVVGKAMATGERFRNQQVEITGHRGGRKTVHYNVFPLNDLDGACIGGFCLYLDMTEVTAKERRIEEQNRTISRAAAEANAIAEQVSGASEELSSRVGESMRGAAEQRQMAGEAATAMDQMNGSVLEVARNAGNAAAGAEDAKTKAQDGAAIVGEAVKAIFTVREQTLDMKGKLGELGRQAESIGQVMGVIGDIADQTNLLALNAAIEAARAGDAGRGFAVVADEVRKLAEKTMGATKEVGQAIASIQSGTAANLAAMDGAVHAVEGSTGLAEQAGGALKEIVALVESTADRVRCIAAASEEQSAASEQINRAIERINRISEVTAESMTRSSQAIAGLSGLSANLRAVTESMQG